MMLQMDSLIFLVPIGLLIMFVALGAFFWAVHNRQYDDLEGAAQRILFDERPMDKK